jgi:NAD(P)-dependent dehydrogenase (short-subunit alcohol dehydrogenase family)
MKTAVITGVSSGIGRATAELLARNRFHTFGKVRSDSAPIPKVKPLRIDVRDPEAARAGVAAVLDRAGRIEFLVNNANGCGQDFSQLRVPFRQMCLTMDIDILSIVKHIVSS